MSIPVTSYGSQQSLTVRSATASGATANLYLYTGIVNFSFQGNGGSFRYDTLAFEVGPSFAVGKVMDVQVLFGLSNLFNKNSANNAGWSVDSMQGAYNSTEGRVVVSCRVGVSDNDGFVNGLTYNVWILASP